VSRTSHTVRQGPLRDWFPTYKTMN
jgi:hypothetical protein